MGAFKTHIKEIINTTPDRAYDVFLNVDPTKIYSGFGPVPACVAIEDQSSSWPEVGASRKIITAHHHSSVEQIVELREYSYLKLITNQFTDRHFDFIDRMECDIRLTERSGNKTVFDWTYTFISVRMHLKARVVAGVVFPPALKRAISNLKYYAENGIYRQ